MKHSSKSQFNLPTHVSFLLNRLRERLWVKPLAICILSIIAVFVAGFADRFELLHEFLPDISSESLKTLLSIVSSSMLVIAIFAVGAMLSAYASASNAATPRSFPLVLADDVSQNALSTFIGAFIFGIVGLSALLNSFYDRPGRFILYLLTIIVFAIVILSFVRWVDRIARLGRLGTTVDRVESATAAALRTRAGHPTLGAKKASATVLKAAVRGVAIYSDTVGYVQQINVAKLQDVAEKLERDITVVAIPGKFSTPDQALAYLEGNHFAEEENALAQIAQAFRIGGDRTFDEDPRFGLIVLSEIASRALSPAVNDPGTAIDIIGTYVRLFTLWIEARRQQTDDSVLHDRVLIPELTVNDMFDDAFNAVARDCAASVAVGIRLQKAFNALASLGHPAIRAAALAHAKYALQHAELALKLPQDFNTIAAVAAQNLHR